MDVMLPPIEASPEDIAKALFKSPNNQETENMNEIGWQGHRLIQGDACLRSTIRKESVDLIITSPPYNLGKAYNGNGNDDSLDYTDYIKFSRKWLRNCYYWTKPTGRICINVGLDMNKGGKNPVCADITSLALKLGWKYHATIIWNEGNISRRTAWGSWMSASAPHVIAPVEVIIVLYKGNWKRENQGKNDITADEFKEWVLGSWNFNGESAKRIGHEAPFPRELPKRCIKLFSFMDDVVLDPFLGSGTTMIEAIENNRIAWGIEKEKSYFNLAKNRIHKDCGTTLEECNYEEEINPARPNIQIFQEAT